MHSVIQALSWSLSAKMSCRQHHCGRPHNPDCPLPPQCADLILKQDSLRCVTLLARDAASLAIALCARAEDAGVMWRQLAAAFDESITHASTAEQGGQHPAGSCCIHQTLYSLAVSWHSTAWLQCPFLPGSRVWKQAPAAALPMQRPDAAACIAGCL